MSTQTNISIDNKTALATFRDFVALVDRQMRLLHLSKKGISVLRGMPRMIEVLAEVEGHSENPDDQLHLTNAKSEAELAQREVDEDFPLLHAQTVVALWSALEASIRLFVVRWLQIDRAAMQVEAVQKLKVKIGEYEQMQGQDRFFYILDRLELEVSAPLRCGIARFESILEPFGLSASVDEDVKRDIFELNQIRNVLVHRSGMADRKLVGACPWLGLKVGDAVQLKDVDVRRYFVATMAYAIELIARVGERSGRDMREFRPGGKNYFTTL